LPILIVLNGVNQWSHDRPSRHQQLHGEISESITTAKLSNY